MIGKLSGQWCAKIKEAKTYRIDRLVNAVHGRVLWKQIFIKKPKTFKKECSLLCIAENNRYGRRNLEYGLTVGGHRCSLWLHLTWPTWPGIWKSGIFSIASPLVSENCNDLWQATCIWKKSSFYDMHTCTRKVACSFYDISWWGACHALVQMKCFHGTLYGWSKRILSPPSQWR